MSRPTTLLRTAIAATALSLLAAGCSGSSQSASGLPTIVTSFYPLQFVTQAIAGDTATVTVLTKPGAEPHELELAAQDLAGMTKAELVVYSDGFQPAVDDAVTEVVDPAKVLDVADSARLTLSAAEEDHTNESAAQHADHAGDGHDGLDPHFWLDPQRYASVAKAIGARLAADDPANAATYQANTTSFVAKLTALDTDIEKGLASCTSKQLVTSHAAFAYFSDRYGFEQHSISGISPEAEPSAMALKEVSDLVRTDGITTIYQETLVEPHFAETVAGSTGATLATLDPIEGISKTSAGSDYFEIMRSNLAVLEKGQGCS
ncbi:MAG: metal ABC transporter substrate-binding protein [Terracoccus sp.]